MSVVKENTKKINKQQKMREKRKEMENLFPQYQFRQPSNRQSTERITTFDTIRIYNLQFPIENSLGKSCA